MFLILIRHGVTRELALVPISLEYQSVSRLRMSEQTDSREHVDASAALCCSRSCTKYAIMLTGADRLLASEFLHAK